MTEIDWSNFTAEEVIQAMYVALKHHDMPAVASLMRLLAVKDSASAELMLAVVDALPEKRTSEETT